MNRNKDFINLASTYFDTNTFEIEYILGISEKFEKDKKELESINSVGDAIRFHNECHKKIKEQAFNKLDTLKIEELSNLKIEKNTEGLNVLWTFHVLAPDNSQSKELSLTKYYDVSKSYIKNTAPDNFEWAVGKLEGGDDQTNLFLKHAFSKWINYCDDIPKLARLYRMLPYDNFYEEKERVIRKLLVFVKQMDI